MPADDLLLYETRVRYRYAAIAGVAAGLQLVASAILLSGVHAKVDELTASLIVDHKRYVQDVIGSVFEGLGVVALSITLAFLYRAARAREPKLNVFPRIAAIGGGVLSAVGICAFYVERAIKANEFVSHGTQTYAQAHDLTSSALFLVPQLVAQAGGLLLAIGFVLTALNAMRIGLLPRFMGYVGIFSGVLVIIPIGSPIPIVQCFWLFALAYLISGRWPNGVPPSWRTGRPEPWPSSAQLREQRIKAGATRSSKPAPKPASREPVGASSSRSTRSTTPKRKRKRRS
jgi:hypothetical protein